MSEAKPPPGPFSGDELEPISTTDQFVALIVYARHFLDYAGLLAPVAADTDQPQSFPPGVTDFITRKAIVVAQDVANLLAGFYHWPDWADTPLLTMATPGYLGFTLIFYGIIERWGFAGRQETRPDGRPIMIYSCPGRGTARLPLAVSYLELAAMERAHAVLARVTAGGVTVGKPKEFAFTARGLVPIVAGAKDRFWADPEAGKVGFVGGQEWTPGREAATWVQALLDTGDRPLTFAEAKRRYAALSKANGTVTQRKVPAPIQEAIEKVPGWRFKSDPPPVN